MMKIKYGNQISIDNLKDVDIDLFIFANNSENRKYCLLDKITENNNILRAISLYYKETFEEKYNFVENKLIKDHGDIEDLLDQFINNCKKDELKIIIDYSCILNRGIM